MSKNGTDLYYTVKKLYHIIPVPSNLFAFQPWCLPSIFNSELSKIAFCRRHMCGLYGSGVCNALLLFELNPFPGLTLKQFHLLHYLLWLPSPNLSQKTALILSWPCWMPIVIPQSHFSAPID